MCLGQLILPLFVPYLPQRADGRSPCKQHICSLNKCLRGTQHVPGTVLGTADTAVNKVPAFKELALWRVEIDSKVIHNVPEGENAIKKNKAGLGTEWQGVG